MSETVYGAIAAAAARWPDRPALHVTAGTAAAYGIAAGDLSYDALLAAADRWAERLVAAGYGPGCRVAVLLENRPGYFALWAGLNRIGASVVPVNPDLRHAELDYLIGHAAPALAVALPDRQADVRAAAASAGVALEVIGEADAVPPARPGAAVATDTQEAAVLYTSGTTGAPKGCVLRNDYFLLAGQWYAGLGGLAWLGHDGERMLTPLPVFHMNAMAYSFMAMVRVGGCLIALDRFHPRRWWAEVAASGATCLHYLGVMPSILMGLDEAPEERAHSVRFGFGAGVDPALHAPFEARFGFPLVEAWAMTETGAGAVIANAAPDRLVGQASLGRPAGWVATRIVDGSGEDARRGTPGELLVRNGGPDPRAGFFAAYCRDAEATEAAWDGGWFHTGDVVRQDAAGRIFFVDRKKNVIRRSGENIAAVEVESVLMRHPAVRAAGVAAVPDAVRGDEVFALLVAEGGTEALARAIADWALGQMAYYKVPGYVAFADALPLTGTQKIARGDLKRLAAERVGAAGTVDLRDVKKRRVA
ncbi:MAG: AMP-binding protein [Pseudomonadota bacterium]